MLKKLFTHSFLYSIGPQLPRVVSIILLPIITRYLTTTDYAIYGIITSYLYFIGVLKDLGFGVLFVNSYYKRTINWPLIWRLLHGYILQWLVIYVFILLLLLKLTIPSEAKEHFWWIVLLNVIPIVLFENTNSIGSYYFRFAQKPLIVTIATVLSGAVSVIGTYYCVVYLRLGYLSWFISSFAASFVTFIFYAPPLYLKMKLYPIFRVKYSLLKSYLKVSLPMVLHNYSSYLLNSSDRIVLDRYKTPKHDIGVYNIAYQFGNYFEVIGNAVGMAVGPFYTKLYTSKDAKALSDEKLLTFFLTTVFLIGVFISSIWMKEIFQLMISNTELSKGYTLGIIIVMGYAYRPMYWSVGIKFSTFESTSVLWKISTVAGIINILLNVIFVPFYGITASAIATFLSLMYAGFSGYYFKKYKELPGLNHYPHYWIISIIFLTICAYLLKDVNITLKTIITLLCLGSLAALFQKNYSRLASIKV